MIRVQALHVFCIPKGVWWWEGKDDLPLSLGCWGVLGNQCCAFLLASVIQAPDVFFKDLLPIPSPHAGLFPLWQVGKSKPAFFGKGWMWTLQRAVAAASLSCGCGWVMCCTRACCALCLLFICSMAGLLLWQITCRNKTEILLRVLCCAGPMKHHSLLCQAWLLHS